MCDIILLINFLTHFQVCLWLMKALNDIEIEVFRSNSPFIIEVEFSCTVTGIMTGLDFGFFFLACDCAQ